MTYAPCVSTFNQAPKQLSVTLTTFKFHYCRKETCDQLFMAQIARGPFQFRTSSRSSRLLSPRAALFLPVANGADQTLLRISPLPDVRCRDEAI